MNTKTRIRSTARVLRFLAVCEMLIFSITFLPDSFIASFHVWLGLGHMPDSVFLHYIIRGATLCQGAVGVALWIVASDVVRYRPLVVATAVTLLVAAPSFYFIDTNSGMPFAARAWDCTACFVAGAVLIALCVWPTRTSTQPSAPGDAGVSSAC
jgi:hypothetical protein